MTLPSRINSNKLFDLNHNLSNLNKLKLVDVIDIDKWKRWLSCSNQCIATAGWRGPNPLKRRFGSILPALAKHCSAASLGPRTVKMFFIWKIMVMFLPQMLRDSHISISAIECKTLCFEGTFPTISCSSRAEIFTL